MHRNVIDAVVNQIRADRIVPIKGKSDFQFGADAVHTGHEHGVARETLQGKESAERANLPQHTRVESAARQLLDAGLAWLAASISTPASR